MGFFSGVKNWLTRGDFKESVPNTPEWKGEHFDFGPWDNNVFIGARNNTLTTNEAIFSVITRLANTVSSLPIHLYHNYSEVNDSVAHLLHDEVNPSMSSFELINQLEVSRDSDGNGYALIERDPVTQTPIRLWPIDPATVVVKRNTEDNSIWYEISSTEFHVLVFNTEVIHVKHITPLSGVIGISPIDVLRGPLDFEKAVEDFSLNEMDKKDAYIIKYDRSVSPEKRQAMIRDFSKMIHQNGGAVVQEKGFDYDRFESKFQPADLKTSESITRARIANAFNVPLAFLNENSSGSNTSSGSEQMMIQFVTMTLIPIIRQYEAEFNRKLLTVDQRKHGYYFKINVNGLMRGDTASRTNFYQMMLRNGLASPNEVRQLEDMPAVNEPNANKLWFSGDLYPIDMAGQRQPSNNNLASDDDNSSTKGGESNEPNNDDSKVPDNQTGSQRKGSRTVY